jgi:hypothetical protein
MVGTMVECIRRNCTNEAIGGNSYKKSLCNPCRKRHSRGEELYVSCTICKKSIYIQNMSGGPRFTCSETCAKERVRNRNKERYDGKLANMKRCKRCNKLLKKDFVSFALSIVIIKMSIIEHFTKEHLINHINLCH